MCLGCLEVQVGFEAVRHAIQVLVIGHHASKCLATRWAKEVRIQRRMNIISFLRMLTQVLEKC